MTDIRPFDPALFHDAAIDADTANLNARCGGKRLEAATADQPTGNATDAGAETSIWWLWGPSAAPSLASANLSFPTVLPPGIADRLPLHVRNGVRNAHRPEVRFAGDSPVEGDGFEPSVPG
jgi:hypothetical protein